MAQTRARTNLVLAACGGSRTEPKWARRGRVQGAAKRGILAVFKRAATPQTALPHPFRRRGDLHHGLLAHPKRGGLAFSLHSPLGMPSIRWKAPRAGWPPPVSSRTDCSRGDNLLVLMVPPGQGRRIRCGPPAPVIPICPDREPHQRGSSGLVVLILVALGIGAVWVGSDRLSQLGAVGQSVAAWIESGPTSSVPQWTSLFER
jgi:hypothetical protein